MISAGTWGHDVTIYLNKKAWEMMSLAQKNYLLELYHLDIVEDKNYNTKYVDDGRPKLTE